MRLGALAAIFAFYGISLAQQGHDHKDKYTHLKNQPRLERSKDPRHCIELAYQRQGAPEAVSSYREILGGRCIGSYIHHPALTNKFRVVSCCADDEGLFWYPSEAPLEECVTYDSDRKSQSLLWEKPNEWQSLNATCSHCHFTVETGMDKPGRKDTSPLGPFLTCQCERDDGSGEQTSLWVGANSMRDAGTRKPSLWVTNHGELTCGAVKDID
ncbi:hypothetical protein EsH8_IX_000087 [Colletotrichum jinshuiense]